MRKSNKNNIREIQANRTDIIVKNHVQLSYLLLNVKAPTNSTCVKAFGKRTSSSTLQDNGITCCYWGFETDINGIKQIILGQIPGYTKIYELQTHGSCLTWISLRAVNTIMLFSLIACYLVCLHFLIQK